MPPASRESLVHTELPEFLDRLVLVVCLEREVAPDPLDPPVLVVLTATLDPPVPLDLLVLLAPQVSPVVLAPRERSEALDPPD